LTSGESVAFNRKKKTRFSVRALRSPFAEFGYIHFTHRLLLTAMTTNQGRQGARRTMAFSGVTGPITAHSDVYMPPSPFMATWQWQCFTPHLKNEQELLRLCQIVRIRIIIGARTEIPSSMLG
jgi:hypothetical protein